MHDDTVRYPCDRLRCRAALLSSATLTMLE